MFIEDRIFRVDFSLFAERHFCKDFLRKYKNQWDHTKRTIRFTLERAYEIQKKSLIDVLRYSQEDQKGIFKFDFKVAGTNQSPKSSGNRAIFSLCNKTGKIEILLVYAKTHCDKRGAETQWIMGLIKENFPEYRGIIRGA
jgi:hypothetical protein